MMNTLAVLDVDPHGAHILAGLTKELTAAGIHLRAVEAHSSVRERLRAQGVDAGLGTVDRLTSVADAVEGFEGRPN